MSTVLVCDDSGTVRESLKRAISPVPGVTRVITASSGEECLARWPVERPSVVLMDVRMPGLGGVESTRQLVERHPEANVLMLTVRRGRRRRGPRGQRRCPRLRGQGRRPRGAVRRGAARHSPRAAGRRARPRTGTDAGHQAPELTEREVQVLTGMSRGRSNAEIGRELFLSEDTVKTHARRLFRKLGAADRAQAVALGYRAGLVR